MKTEFAAQTELKSERIQRRLFRIRVALIRTGASLSDRAIRHVGEGLKFFAEGMYTLDYKAFNSSAGTALSITYIAGCGQNGTALPLWGERPIKGFLLKVDPCDEVKSIKNNYSSR